MLKNGSKVELPILFPEYSLIVSVQIFKFNTILLYVLKHTLVIICKYIPCLYNKLELWGASLF